MGKRGVERWNQNERRGKKGRGEVAWRGHKKERKDGRENGKEKGKGEVKWKGRRELSQLDGANSHVYT